MGLYLRYQLCYNEYMKEQYQPASETNGAEWQTLAAMPDFATHEAMRQSDLMSDDLAREIGTVVDQALKERAEQGGVANEEESSLEATQELDCDILDEEWAPEFDKRYRRELSHQEQYDQNQQELGVLNNFLQLTPESRAQYLEVESTLLGAMSDDIRKLRAQAAELNVAPEEMKGYNELYERACQRRRGLQLLEHPEANQKMLTAEQVKLGRELAKDDPRYHDAIEGMDPAIIDQNINAILESAPPRDFDKLAKLMNRPDKWPTFQREVQDVLVRALGLEDVDIKVEMFVGSDDGEKGSCTPVDGGYNIQLNATQIGQNTWAYAQVLAHELYHVMQGRVSEAGGTDMAELYDFNMQHYGRPGDVGYEKYKNQLKEAEAFRFMDRFLDEIQAGDRRNQQTLVGRLKHWWQERDTEKLPDGEPKTPVPPIPPSDNAVMLKTQPDSDEKLNEK